MVEPPSAFDIDAEIAAVAAAFSKLLGLGSVPINDSRWGTLGRVFRRSKRFWINGQEIEACLDLFRLKLFVNNLSEVKDRDLPTFKRLRRRLRRATGADFYGVHQECMVASMLARHPLDFDHESPGQPDFIVPAFDSSGIECTSVHFTKRADSNPTYKLASALNNKAAKSYAAPSVVLAIGATNVYGNGGLDVSVRRVVREALEKTAFGAVLLFVEYLDLEYETARVYSSYIRVDAKQMATGLRKMLDDVWPSGNGPTVRRFVVQGGPIEDR
jgi:hypothetical protein